MEIKYNNYDLEGLLSKYGTNQELGFNFKKKLFENIGGIIENNYNLIENINSNSNLFNIIGNIVKTPNEIIEIFKLRYEVFKKRDYNDLISDELKKLRLNFDDYDKNSILLKYNRGNKISASTRLVLDKENKLLSENLYDNKNGFNEIRYNELKNGKCIAEISRSSILPEYQNKGIEFRVLFKKVYEISKILNIGTYITAIAKEDYKLYEKIGFKIIGEDFGYDKINTEVLYLSWDVKNPNNFFKKLFLRD